MTTLCEPISTTDELFDPSNTKVIFDENGYAIYFSRAVIPWSRDDFSQTPKQLPDDYTYYRHIGLYAYRAGFIKQYINWSETPWERLESLEQLRALWHGEKIHVDIAELTPGIGIDTQVDLDKARAMLLTEPQ